MQIHYCNECNSRVDSDHAVTVDDKVYCKKCADAMSADDYLVKSDGIPPRSTPGKGIQRVTPGKMGRKTPTKMPMRSPPKGTSTINSGKTPIRGSKYGIKPASPARGTAVRPATPAKGTSLRPGSGGRNSPPSSESGESDSNPNVSPARHVSPDSRKIRSSGSSTMVWGFAIAGILLVAAAFVLMFYGNQLYGPPSPPPANSTSSGSATATGTDTSSSTTK